LVFVCRPTLLGLSATNAVEHAISEANAQRKSSVVARLLFIILFALTGEDLIMMLLSHLISWRERASGEHRNFYRSGTS